MCNYSNRPNRESLRNTPATLRSPNRFIRTYRSLQVLVNQFNRAALIALPGQHGVTTLLLIYFLATTILFFDLIHFKSIVTFISYAVFPFGALTMGVWILVIHGIAAELSTASEMLKIHWKAHFGSLRASQGQGQRLGLQEYKIMMRTLWSFNNVTIDVGSFFKYGLSVIRNMANIVLNNAAALLIAQLRVYTTESSIWWK